MLISDPVIQAIPIKENSELLIDLRTQSLIQIEKPDHHKNNDSYSLIRATVYYKLLQAQALLPANLKLCVYEGFRGVLLQQELFNIKYNQLTYLYRHKKYSQEHVFLETTTLVSPAFNIDGSKNVPPHSTGGAIDVSLIDQSHNRIDMGIGLYEQHNNKQELAKINSLIISKDAAYYRNIMRSALSRAGFINYATEYWHWSYGDKYWAFYTNHEHAIYGEIK